VRAMNLPNIPVAVHSREECIELYSERLLEDHARWPAASALLTAYMAWPNNEERRYSFVATHLVRFSGPSDEKTGDASPDAHTLQMFGGISAIAKPAFDQLTNEISQLQRKWLWVTDIFQFTLDMAFDQRIAPRRGSSISKAVELCEIEHGLPGHSQLQSSLEQVS
jgi:hypothetical protein